VSEEDFDAAITDLAEKVGRVQSAAFVAGFVWGLVAPCVVWFLIILFG
jgi:hypothetical protein